MKIASCTEYHSKPDLHAQSIIANQPGVPRSTCLLSTDPEDMALVLSLCESTSASLPGGKLLSALLYWHLASFCSALTSALAIALFSPGRSTMPQGRARDSHTVTDTGCHPGIRGPLCSYLSLTEKIQPLSHSRHLLRCLPLGLAHNFGCQNLLRASLLQ